MVTGRRAFDGEDISDTLAAVLHGEPEWTALPATLSPALVALLRGCLDRDRRRRVADLSIARYIIDREREAVTAVAVSPASTIRRAASILVAVAAGAGIAAYTTSSLTRVSAPSLPVARATIALPMGDRFSNPAGAVAALSPDGTRLVYAANQRLYLRPLDQLEPTLYGAFTRLAHAALRTRARTRARVRRDGRDVSLLSVASPSTSPLTCDRSVALVPSCDEAANCCNDQ
jgi:eukaryotic-like serine/threonine-protein kinase